MPPLVIGTIELLLLGLAAAALGQRLLRLLCIQITDAGVDRICGLAVGLGALQFLPFALFALGIGTQSMFRAASAMLMLLLLKDMAGIAGFAFMRMGSLWPKDSSERILAGAVLLLGTGIYARALCPAVDGDPLSYHLTTAYRYLNLHHFAYLPTLTYANWPVGEQMLFALLLGISRSSPPAIVQFLYGFIVLCGGVIFAHRLGGKRTAVMAFVLFLVYGMVQKEFIGEMTSAYTDTGLTAYAILATFTFYLAIKAGGTTDGSQFSGSKQSGDLLQLTAVLAGLAITIKLTGIWLGIAILITWLRLKGKDTRQDLRLLARFCITIAVISLPWLVKTFVFTGNPVYPFLFKQFGGVEWTSEGMARFSHGNLMWNTPPGMQPTESVLRLSHLFNATVGTSAAAISLICMRKSAEAIPARIAALFIASICITTFFHTRFIMPVAPVLLIMAANRLAGHSASFPRLTAGLSAVLCGVLTFSLYPDLPQAIKVCTGHQSRESYMRDAMSDYEVTRAANTLVPSTSRILVGTYANNLAYYDAEALWPEWWLQDSVHYESQDRLEADFKRLGIQYLVLNPDFPDWCQKSHSCRERMQREPSALLLLARRRGHVLYSARGHTLYKIELP